MKKVKIFLTFILILLFTSCTLNSNKNQSVKFKLQEGNNIHTIAFVSDTQKYAQINPDLYKKIFASIIQDKNKYNIEYVIHAGDLVQQENNEEEWIIAKNSISQLDGIIPYGVLAGNHDQGIGDNRFTKYFKYFGDDLYNNKYYFGESYDNCRAHYQLININNTEFIVVYISDDPNKDCINFANNSFSKYKNRVGILVTHKYLKNDLTLDDMGKYIFDKIIKNNENIYLVLCGHEEAAGCIETKVNDNRTVLQIIANYQGINDGTIMYLQIDDKNNTLNGITYSPITNSYEGYNNQNSNSFSVKIPW